MFTAQIIIGIICGAACAVLANYKGRNIIGWTFFGMFFGVIPIVILLVIPNLREERSHREHVLNEQHRLREQLRQERIKGDAFQQHVARRLDSHDQALGVRTRADAALPEPGAAEPGETAPANAHQDDAAVRSENGELRWYYEQEGASRGPVSEEEIRRMLLVGVLNGRSLVWNDDLDQWVPAAIVPSMEPYVKAE